MSCRSCAGRSGSGWPAACPAGPVAHLAGGRVGPVRLVFESQRASDAPEGQHPDPRSGRSACSLPRISFKTPCLLGLMRMPCAQDPTRTPVRRGPCISAPPRDPPAEAATSLADAGPRDRAAPAKFNTTQTASISVASRVPYLQHATLVEQPESDPRRVSSIITVSDDYI